MLTPDDACPSSNSVASTKAADGPPPAISVSAFLAQIAGLLQTGLPGRLWIEATVVAVRASAHGHTLELADAAVGRGAPATLRVFLGTATLATLRADLGVALDPALLAGLTTAILVGPASRHAGISAAASRA